MLRPTPDKRSQRFIRPPGAPGTPPTTTHRQRDPRTGRFVRWTAPTPLRRSYRENYPTSRKHCNNCGRWRPLIDFQVRRWLDEPACTIPNTLTSTCTRCMAASARERNGYSRRKDYPHGAPGSRAHREHQRQRNRASRARRMRRKSYRQAVNEYHRIWRNAKSGKSTNRRGRLPTSPAKLLPRAPFDELLTVLGKSQHELSTLTGLDRRLFAQGRNSYITVFAADQTLTALGMHDQLAVLWPDALE